MSRHDRALVAISSAHGAAIGDVSWQVFLQQFNELIGGVFATLEIVDMTDGSYLDFAASQELEVNESLLSALGINSPVTSFKLTLDSAKTVRGHLLDAQSSRSQILDILPFNATQNKGALTLKGDTSLVKRFCRFDP